MRNAAAIVIALALLAEPLLQAVDIKIVFDKTFDLKSIRSWTWSPAGGEVKMLVSAQDDPAAVKKNAYAHGRLPRRHKSVPKMTDAIACM